LTNQRGRSRVAMICPWCGAPLPSLGPGHRTKECAECGNIYRKEVTGEITKADAKGRRIEDEVKPADMESSRNLIAGMEMKTETAPPTATMTPEQWIKRGRNREHVELLLSWLSGEVSYISLASGLGVSLSRVKNLLGATALRMIQLFPSVRQEVYDAIDEL